MYYSNKCQLFCTRKHSVDGKIGSKLCESLLKPVNKDGYDAKALICLKLICQVIDSKLLYLVVGHLC